MKTLHITVAGKGKRSLTQKNYLASGGEASVYKSGQTVYKVYHDQTKICPPDKIKELDAITASNVLKPRDLIYDNKTGKPIGFTMPYIPNTHPLCKLFTKSFRQTNKISNQRIIEIVKRIQETIISIHKAKCLVVDLNELNMLVDDLFKIVYFIDVDSFQTPSFKATAIMDSIRDRLVKNQQFTELSDWFSFAVISFQLYIGIHPYKGIHPDYKPNEWLVRMDNGISVFDPKVTLPKICNNLSVIPKKHLDWFKNIFVKNDRSVPPFPDGVIIAVPDIQIRKVTSYAGDFIIELQSTYNEDIITVFPLLNNIYVVTEKRVYKDMVPLPINIEEASKVYFCSSDNGDIIVGKQLNQLVEFETISGQPIGSIRSSKMMLKNNCIYTICNEQLVANLFVTPNVKTVHTVKPVCNISEQNSKFFDGIIFQDLLGKCYVTIPYEKTKCIIFPIPELDKYRILEAKCDQYVIIVIGEHKGKYDRFIIHLNKPGDKQYCVFQKDENISYEAVNFIMLERGVCIVGSNVKSQIFVSGVKKDLVNPPFNADTKLFTKNNVVHYIENDKIYTVRMK